MKKKKAFYALAVMILLGAGLALFIIAVEEQSVISSGLPAADRIRLHDLITQGSGRNKHVELVDFYFGKQYIYMFAPQKWCSSEMSTCRCFLNGEPENASNVQILLWIRNDRNSNEPLVAYPGTNRQSLQILWARHFPDQQSINVLWGILTLCLVAAVACAVAYRRQSRSSRI